MYIYLITNSLIRYCNKIIQGKYYGAGAGYCNNNNNNHIKQVAALALFILPVVANDGSDSVGV